MTWINVLTLALGQSYWVAVKIRDTLHTTNVTGREQLNIAAKQKVYKGSNSALTLRCVYVRYATMRNNKVICFT